MCGLKSPSLTCVVMWGGTAALCLSLVACGVPTQDSAQPLATAVIAPPAIPPTASPDTTTSEPSPTQSLATVNLWFVSETGLVPVESEVEAPLSAESMLAGLVAGPPSNQQVRTVVVDPLTGEPLVAVFTGDIAAPSAPAGAPSPTPETTVAISLAPEFGTLPSNEQVLVLGQVVLSISGSGLGSVAFVDQTGSPVAVPLPDGLLLDRPATATDYRSLVA